MENYFLILNQQEKVEKWFNKWWETCIQKKVRLGIKKSNLPGIVYDGEKPVKSILHNNKYYLFTSDAYDDHLTDVHDILKYGNNDDEMILINLLELQYQDIRDNNLITTWMEKIRKFIADKFSFSLAEAELFICHLYFLHQEIRSFCERGNCLVINAPTLSEHKAMKETNNEKYDMHKYKLFQGMRSRSIWKQDDMIQFAEEILIPFLKQNYVSAMIRDIIKFPKGQDVEIGFREYLVVLEVSLQVAFSFGKAENKRFRHFFKNPPNIPKKRLSDKVTLNVLKACCQLHRDKPEMKETNIMDHIAEKRNFNPTTIRNTIRENLDCSPKKVNSILEIFGLNDKEIEIFYNNLLKIKGY
ncbi:MAG: hypothetical protein APR54_10345 [Candidatus Cloacimonas sp. SDB]|nr:MAG: hypothetical protein APR54_10345 [Candidatus Cloacimonas sp. SDB]